MKEKEKGITGQENSMCKGMSEHSFCKKITSNGWVLAALKEFLKNKIQRFRQK